MTINGIEKPIEKYVAHVWEGLTIDDYKILLQKTPNEKVEASEIYQEYKKKLKTKNGQELWNKVFTLEQDKLLYFIITFSQKVVLVKTGEKNDEKRFLGYEFSNRRGSEGIHPTQRSKSIDECTQLYDPNTFENSEKASTYIYKAFNNEFNLDIPESLQKNISYQSLVDMLSFDRVDFEKSISLSVKKKVAIESKWQQIRIKDLAETVLAGGDVPKDQFSKEKSNKFDIPIYSNGIKEDGLYGYTNEARIFDPCVTVSARGTIGFTKERKSSFYPIVRLIVVIPKQDIALTKYLEEIFNRIEFEQYAVGTPQLTVPQISEYKIPLPPKEIQEKIVVEIEILEQQEEKAVEDIKKLKEGVGVAINNSKGSLTKLEDITSKIGSGATPKGGKGSYQESGISLIRSQNIYNHGFLEKGLAFINDEQAKKLDNVTVKKDDILFNITGASIARCCIVEEKYLPARVNQHVSIIRTNDKALPKYVQMILVSPEYKDKLLQIGDGGTSREAITKLQLEEFKIPLPIIKEQQKIVAEIEKIESKIAGLENKIAEIPKKKDEILKKHL